MMRGLLAGFTGAAANSLRFCYGTSGKPSLAGHGIEFNISHSAEVGLFAFAPDRAVGIDVENVRPVRRLLDVAQRFLSEDDVRALASKRPEERDATFLKSWVVREARLKAEGKGIWSGPESTNGLTHRLFSPRPGYIAAVAAAGPDWRLYTCSMSRSEERRVGKECRSRGSPMAEEERKEEDIRGGVMITMKGAVRNCRELI